MGWRINWDILGDELIKFILLKVERSNDSFPTAVPDSLIIFGDCDSTCDFRNLSSIYRPLARKETNVIIGDRFAGLMEDGAMPVSHRLSFFSIFLWSS